MYVTAQTFCFLSLDRNTYNIYAFQPSSTSVLSRPHCPTPCFPTFMRPQYRATPPVGSQPPYPYPPAGAPPVAPQVHHRPVTHTTAPRAVPYPMAYTSTSQPVRPKASPRVSTLAPPPYTAVQHENRKLMGLVLFFVFWMGAGIFFLALYMNKYLF